MQRNRTGMSFVKMLMNFERISLAAEFAAERLMQRRQLRASDVYDRSVHLGDRTDW
jgi:hypothetical protein